MARIGVTELLESLGLKDHSTSDHRARAIFHYEPVLKLYRLEIPSLFGRLLRDESIFLDRADPNLFETELDELLTELGPLIWPLPGQGPRDHLLKPVEGSRYTSDLVFPRDKTILIRHLRAQILSKQARPDVNVDALIQKRHKGARFNPFSKAEPGRLKTREGKDKVTKTNTKADERVRRSRQVSLTDESSELPEIPGPSTPNSDDSVVIHSVRRRTRSKGTREPFQVALRLYRKTNPDEWQGSGPCHSYGIVFLNDFDTAAQCFAHIHQHTSTDCTYIEFHPPEDMSLEGKIRINRHSEEADDVCEHVVNMLRAAPKFPAEPSYRTVEVEIGSDEE